MHEFGAIITPMPITSDLRFFVMNNIGLYVSYVSDDTPLFQRNAKDNG